MSICPIIRLTPTAKAIRVNLMEINADYNPHKVIAQQRKAMMVFAKLSAIDSLNNIVLWRYALLGNPPPDHEKAIDYSLQRLAGSETFGPESKAILLEMIETRHNIQSRLDDPTKGAQ